MPETETFIYQPEQQPAHAYELDATGLTYRPPGHAPVTVRWNEIDYLEDVSGQKVHLVVKEPPQAIPLFYATRDFAGLLAGVCSRLADLHRAQIGVQTFSGRKSYFIHMGSALGILALLMLAGTVYLHRFTAAWLFILATTLPTMAYLLRQPHTVTPGDDHLVVKDFLRTRSIAYTRIRELAFGLHGDKHVAYLCVKIHLTDGRTIKMQRLENLVLLYIFIKTKWEAARVEG